MGRIPGPGGERTVKRHRVFCFDFDSRAFILSQVIRDEWEDSVKELHRANRRKVEEGLALQYGPACFDVKLQNFIELGSKPFSVLAFHNRFFEQCRMAFVGGSYYPALTGACALG